ncbi:MAG: SpoIIE family protein phosphatase [Phycisphaerae bacterium]|nr:MAG: FHA domain-containing protein [Planctomycetota bacterium]KAB2949298.1 MAG: SpoIIE family protein phosphatase [Phycisphaerae bacterium]MBE7455299.1 SpoIIE family protein phosphatase [Planctomycetia bacterium]MCK6464111.1 SpoIIE family protein phosphatase [Phycisphaerae bacterium]MCL4717715.1 SpoIIE family protein phosphatase [Phycisphaerae bacterium]
MADLAITLSNGQQLQRRVGDGAATLGRDPTCDVWLDDPSVSRRHARIVRVGHGHQVEDLDSKNGTLVNGEQVRSKALESGDVVTLGHVQIVYTREAHEQPPGVVVSDQQVNLETASFSRRAGGPLHLSQQRLQVLYDLSGRLTSLKDRDALLTDAMDICFDMLRFERGAVAVKKPGGRGVDWPVVRHLRGREGELTISRTTLSRALERGEYVIITEDRQREADPTVSMVQLGIRSAMCVPLMYNDEILGVIYGDRTSTSTVYSQEDADFLAGIARQVSIGLINARLLEEYKLKTQMEKDLALARRIQTGLFPRLLPDGPAVRVAALNEPGNRVSGDYYDAGLRPDGTVWALIADVTGEGVAASLLMANLQAAVRVTLHDSADPAALMKRWNELIHRNTDASKFVTALLMMIDPKSRELRMCSAGHPGPCLVDVAGRRVRPLVVEPGFPLGVIDEADFTTQTVTIGPGPHGLFAYTDGVIEARNTEDALFGEDAMIEALSAAADQEPRQILQSVRSAVASFRGTAPQSDDITMLTIALT